MFGFFRRTKIENWETDLLYNVLNQLPDEYSVPFIDQVNEKLHRGVLVGLSDLPGYIGFTFNSDIFNKFYEKTGKRFKLSNISVFDIKSSTYLNYSIYVSFGVINGYSIDNNNRKYKIDLEKIDVSGFRKIYLDNYDFAVLSEKLTSEEKAIVNPSEVYLVPLGGKDYYHLKDLQDGDFLAMDLEKKIYKITQDPFQIILLNEKLVNVMI